MNEELTAFVTLLKEVMAGNQPKPDAAIIQAGLALCLADDKARNLAAYRAAQGPNRLTALEARQRIDDPNGPLAIYHQFCGWELEQSLWGES